MLVQLLLVLVLVWQLVSRWQRRAMIRLSHEIGQTTKQKLPFVGHAYIFLGSDEDRMKAFQDFGRESNKNGGIITVWQGRRLYLCVSDPIAAEYVLRTCLEKDDTMKCLRHLTGNGSVFAPVPIWRPRRKVLAPTFSPKNLIQFAEIFSHQSGVMVDQLRSMAGRGAFSIWKYITTYTMDSVCESTLGVRINAQKNTEQPLLKSFEESAQLDSARLCQPWLHSEAVYRMTRAYTRHDRCRRSICQFIDQLIKDKRRVMDKEKKAESMKQNRQKTFLELLIESSGGDKGYTNLELREETLVLVLAGTDTSAVGTAFASVLLSRHQKVQNKVYKELQEVFGTSNRPVVADDLPKLKYLDAVIRETLRLYPPVPVIARKVVKDVTLPSGTTLVKDCGIVVNIWAMHHNAKYWGDDAEQFKPERFIGSTLKHPAAFMAFGSGPRACIGYQYAMMSMKTALAALLREYRFSPDGEVADEDTPLRVTFSIMMKHVDKFTVKLESRVQPK